MNCWIASTFYCLRLSWIAPPQGTSPAQRPYTLRFFLRDLTGGPTWCWVGCWPSNGSTDAASVLPLLPKVCLPLVVVPNIFFNSGCFSNYT